MATGGTDRGRRGLVGVRRAVVSPAVMGVVMGVVVMGVGVVMSGPWRWQCML